MSRQNVRWGLLSTARINERLIPPIRDCERSELVAVASRTQGKAEAYASDWGIPKAYGSYQEMLDAPDIDAVYISLPNSLHAQWCIQAAAAGKHILCEKPLALSTEEVDRIDAAVRQHNVILQEGAMYRYHMQTANVCELISSGVIGDVRAVNGTLAFVLDNPGDVRLEPDLGGGALWDLGCYPVSFIRTVLDAEPTAVAAVQATDARGIDLSLTGLLSFAGGVSGRFFCSFAALPRWHAEIIGDAGRIELDHPWLNNIGEPAHLHLTTLAQEAPESVFGDNVANQVTERLRYENVNPYVDEVEAMVRAVLDGETPVISLASSRGNIATLVALYRAAREGTVVPLS
ncbi:MAG: Gfo/Idh/MocA family oxidoreductase [Lentisphaeria bacterium]|nr:Gfo/Idh/MocA family oxidoreductase [Lentisphaeria bacterium]MDP7740128.1 Gfo/Idh/MocA family oxidoreductase [Lentisphaeria bacterium]